MSARDFWFVSPRSVSIVGRNINWRNNNGLFSTHRRIGSKGAIERHLRHEPTKVSMSRIKRLRGLSQPQDRLRVADIRVFYDVTETQVQILAIVTKPEAQAWLDEQGTPEGGAEGGGPRRGER